MRESDAVGAYSHRKALPALVTTSEILAWSIRTSEIIEVVHRNYVSHFGLFRECKIEEWNAEFERRCSFRVSGELGGDASQKMVRRQADG